MTVFLKISLCFFWESHNLIRSHPKMFVMNWKYYSLLTEEKYFYFIRNSSHLLMRIEANMDDVRQGKNWRKMKYCYWAMKLNFTKSETFKIKWDFLFTFCCYGNNSVIKLLWAYGKVYSIWYERVREGENIKYLAFFVKFIRHKYTRYPIVLYIIISY